MKKKFLQIVSMVLAVVMILPAAVFADEPTELKILLDGTQVSAVALSDAGSKSTATLTIDGGYDVTWRTTDSNVVSVSNGTITAKGVGSATIYAYYQSLEASCTVTVTARTLTKIDVTGTPKTEYTTGDSFSFGSAAVIATYSDGSTEDVTSKCSVSPMNDLRKTDTSVTVSYTEGNIPKTTSVAISVAANEVTGIQIVSPSNGSKYTVGDVISRQNVSIKVTYSNGDKVTLSAADYSEITFEPSTALTTSNTTLTVSYAGKSDTIAIAVSAKETKTIKTVSVLKLPTKTTYNVNDTITSSDLSGLSILVTYSDDTSATISYSSYPSRFTMSTSKFSSSGNQSVQVTYKDTYGSVTITFTVTVGDLVKVYGLSNIDSDYVIDSDAKITLGKTLDWEDIFEEITIKYYKDSTTSTISRKVIEDEDELEDFLPGARLYLEVYGKNGDEDIVEASDVEDGEVMLYLYLVYGGTTYSSTSKSYRFTMEVEDAECSVTIYKSSTSTSVRESQTFKSFRDALDALEDFDDEFEITLSSANVIRIKFGEDQSLSSTYQFAPDFENDITIDLNGCTLTLPSEWIDYDDCEDLHVTVTSTKKIGAKEDDAKLIYRDKSITLTVAQGDTLEFSEGNIPGIYDITIDKNITNGTVKADKATVGHGDDVKFTITPNTGYKISDVKVDGKSVLKASTYVLNDKTGAAVYTLENVDDDVTITASFVKSTSSTSSTTDKTTANTWTNPFTDISSNDQYYEAVAFVCSEGLFNGMSATKFEPKTTMTRAMFVTVLGRLAKVDTSKYTGSSFTDVSTTDAQISWAVPYIEWGVANGLVQGYGNGKFGPNDPITHQQMYLLMYRYAMFIQNISTPLTGVNISVTDKSDIDTWAEDGVKFATKYNILITSGGKLTPKDNALRCELAMLLHGFCQKVLGYN
ncbi:MAG: S-layer homology domain-containing protein [Eubacteriales bacterium]